MERAASVQYGSRRRRFSILPFGSRGSTSTKSMLRGHLNRAMWSRQCAASVSAKSAPVTWPGAGYAGWARSAVVVEHLHRRTDDGSADGSRLLQPAPRGGDGGRALGSAVRLVDDRAEPVHDPLLDVGRAGRAGVEDALERRHV